MPTTKFIPLSENQQGLWLLQTLHPELSEYNISTVFRIRSRIDNAQMQKALHQLVQEQPLLRTTFPRQDDAAYQAIHEWLEPIFEHVIVSSQDTNEVQAIVQAAHERLFDLARGPLTRLIIFTCAEDDHVLLLNSHHILMDFDTHTKLTQRLFDLYATCDLCADERQSEQYDPPASYDAFVAWQQAYLTSSAATKARAYWQRQLPTPLPILDLPTDHPIPQQQTFHGDIVRFEVSATLSQQLNDLANQQRITTFSLLLTAYALLMARYSNQDDVIVGVPFNERLRLPRRFQQTIGHMVNVLPIRIDLADQPTFLELVQRTQTAMMGGLLYQNYPLVRIVQDAQWVHNTSRSPLFDVSFNMPVLEERADFVTLMEGTPARPVCYRGLQLEPFALCQQAGQSFLNLDLWLAETEFVCFWKYNTDLFDEATIMRMAGHFAVLLEGIVNQPDAPIHELPLLTAAEYQQIVHEWNDTSVDFGEPQTIHALFEQQVARTPDAVALIFEDEQLTYAELNRLANQLAYHLMERGVGPDRLVGICIERSIEMVIGLLGILKAGGAYVALDPTYPVERLLFMIEDAQVQLVVTQRALTEQISFKQTQVVCLEDVNRENGPISTPSVATTPDNLIYVIYTSGSTGQPKGVMATHRNTFNRLQWMWTTLPFASDDVMCQKTALSFVDSVWEIFGPLLQGIPLVVIPDNTVKDICLFVETLHQNRVSRLVLVPSLLRSLLNTYPDLNEHLPYLIHWTCSGEALSTDLCHQFNAAMPKRVLLNLYGSSEVAGDATWFNTVQTHHKIHQHLGVSIGTPVDNSQAFIMDPRMQLTPIGIPGELLIGGVQVARGYLNRSELTEERFIEHPVFGRLYKTGDLCRWLPDGNIEYIGRTDFQVKLRGFRIELGEIESLLLAQPGVREAVVLANEDTPLGARLVAYHVGEAEEAHLRQVLTKQLPDYMVPAAFVTLDAMPLTPNGKLDRRALPAPEYMDRQSEFVAPRNEAEATLASIWQEVLDVEKVGMFDNFFALGGHSLLATQVIAKIRQRFALDLGLSTLFASPTIAAHAEALLTAQQKQPAEEAQGTLVDALPVIIHDPEQRHEPFPLTDVQYAYWVGRSAGFELGNISTHIYFELDAERLDIARLNQAWQQLVERHEMLRCIIQPDGEQRILATVPCYEFATVDLSSLDAHKVTHTLDAIRAEMSHQVLPAEQWPLFDIRVTRLTPTAHRLHFSLDALILDGTSIGTLLREWITLYQNPQALLAPLAVSFRDYVFAERAFTESTLYQRSWAYWQQRLDTLPPAPELPLAQDTQTIQKPHFNTYQFQLDATQWSRLKAHGNLAGLTDSTIILSAFAEILTAWSKEPRFTLNLTLFNRLPLHPQINEILGDFTPLLMLEVDNRPQSAANHSFATRAQRIQQQLWRDLDHRAVNGVRVLRELAKRQGQGADRALMPVVFTSMLATPLDNTLFDPIGKLTYMNSQTPQVWLDHGIIESAGALDISWSVVEELFPAGMVAEMFEAYCALLQRLARDEEAWHTADLSLLPPAQQEQREAVNSTAAPISEEMLHTLFVKQVDKHAAKSAIRTPTMSMTYAELYDRANQVGHWLRAQGITPNSLVGVVMEKGWEQVVAVLGIHFAGAAYLPIDPHLPSERQHYLLSQGEATIALTQSHLDTALTWPQTITRLQIDTLKPDPTLPNLDVVQTPTDLAYVIYTSGSTGQPKGVVIDHRGAVNTVLDVNQRYGITANDSVLALSALNFDLSVYDIFGLLAAGGSIVFPDPARRVDPEHWQELIDSHCVTVWNTVPALMQMLVEYEEGQSDKVASACPEPIEGWQSGRAVSENGHHTTLQLCDSATLRIVMMSGDWIPVTLPERIRRFHPEAAIYSMGGATEASIWSIDYPIREIDPTWPSIPYGKPMTNQTFHVLDANLNPRPTWVPGDLYIGGIGVALGYWNDEERTNASFIIHPQTGARLYKTGDLGRYLPAPKDGLPNIEFLGREDFQVKIRGHRIELGEIESALLQHGAVNEVAVNAVGDPKGHRQLVGYVVLDEPWQTAIVDTNPTDNPLPDVYDDHNSVALTDPVDRLEFKLRQPGIREVGNKDAVLLPTQAFDKTHRNQWMSRRSHRQFLDEQIELHDFSDFLRCLMQMPLDGMPLPKYRYPSAGNLYPVQCYLYIKPERIEGIAGGYYYYRPTDHRLIPLQVDEPPMLFATMNANQAIFEQSAFTLFLVTDLDAIAPMYGELARDFSLLEAGYISQLLMMEAPQYALGLCPIGGIDQATIQAVLALGTAHELVHSLAGGAIDPEQSFSVGGFSANSQSALQADALTWQKQLQTYLMEKLPAYMVPTTFVALPALPLTTNGKVDRKALPTPDLSERSTSESTPPRTAIEQLIGNLWSELLGVEQVGIHDDFFALGGDSLIVTQLRTRLRVSAQIDLPLRTFFDSATIYQLAEEIESYQVAHNMQAEKAVTDTALIETEREEETW